MKFFTKPSSLQRGFTIVELLIVIVVIGILAALVLNSFSGAQAKARDASTRNSVTILAKAIEAWSATSGLTPTTSGSGWGSTANNGNGVCTGGTDGSGWFSSGTYTCTLEDILKANKLLPTGFSASLPPNKNFNNNSLFTLMLYPCSPLAGSYLILYNLEVPTAADNTNYSNTTASCGMGMYEHDTYGMRGVKQYSVSN